MASSPGRRLFVSRDPSVLERVRTGLTSDGAPPSAPSGTALDSTSALGRVSLSVLGLAVERLQSGPAGAVDDLQELYAAGLPAGLPGNLHMVAMNERQELLARLARVAAARKAKDAIRKASGAAIASWSCLTARTLTAPAVRAAWGEPRRALLAAAVGLWSDSMSPIRRPCGST